MRSDSDQPFQPRRFDPNSTDAMFAQILERNNSQDRKLDLILKQVEKTNGRVTMLERWRDILTAKAAVIAGIASLLTTALLKWFLG